MFPMFALFWIGWPIAAGFYLTLYPLVLIGPGHDRR